MAQDFRASILAQLDTSNIQKDIDAIGKRNIKFNDISFDTTQLVNSIQAALSNHRFNVNLGNVNINSQSFNQQAQSMGSGAGQNFTSGFNRAIQGINLSNSINEINRVKDILKSYKFDTSSITAVTKSLETMRLQIDSVKTSISSGSNGSNIRLTIQGTDEMKRAVQVVRELKAGEMDVVEVSRTFTQNFAQQERQAQKNAAAITQYISKLNELRTSATDPNSARSISADSLQSAYDGVISKIRQLQNANSESAIVIKAEIDAEISKFKSLISVLQEANYSANQMRTKSVEVIKSEELNKLSAFEAEIRKSGIAFSSFKTDVSGLRDILNGVTNSSQLESYLNTLSVAKSEFKALKQEAAQYASAADVSILKSKMEAWLTKNTKAAKTYGAAIKGLISELDSMAAKGGVLATENKRIASSFKQIDAAAGAAGLKGRTFFQSVGKAAQSLGRYFGVSTLIYRSIATLRQGINDVIDLDTALVDLQKTAKATSEELSNFYYDANEQAKEFGVTTKEIIQSAADWSRLGYSLNDSKTMAQVSSIFKSISPGMDIDTATNGLVSTMKAYGIEANDALDGIASKINAIGNSQALSNNDIVDFLTRSSSAMAEANNSLEQTIAIGTAATEITQDAASVGK
jgi:hypothetical protein